MKRPNRVDKVMKRHPSNYAATSFGGLSRSELMSRVRSKGNKTTEGKMVHLLRALHITGWRRQIKLLGNPDFVWRRNGLLYSSMVASGMVMIAEET